VKECLLAVIPGHEAFRARLELLAKQLPSLLSPFRILRTFRQANGDSLIKEENVSDQKLPILININTHARNLVC
jgi:hypothetical protein